MFIYPLCLLPTGLVMLDGFVYAVGGWEGRSRLDSVECYNPHTNSWQFTESVKMAVTSPAVVALDGLLYVTGRKHRFLHVQVFFFFLFVLILCGAFIHSGCVTAGGAVLEDGDGTDLAQVYNPKTAVWTEVAPMQIARSGSAACTLKGKIYVIGNKLIIQPINCALFWFLKVQSCLLNAFFVGGWHASTENTDKVECYNPKTNQWTMCAPMKERRYRPGAAVVDGKIYVLGGEEGWDR